MKDPLAPERHVVTLAWSAGGAPTLGRGCLTDENRDLGRVDRAGGVDSYRTAAEQRALVGQLFEARAQLILRDPVIEVTGVSPASCEAVGRHGGVALAQHFDDCV